MKTKNLLLQLVLIALLIVFGVQGSKAQNVSVRDALNEPHSPIGSSLKSEDLVPRCNAILIGTILDMGLASAKSPDRMAFYHVKVSPSQVLFGKVRHTISVTIHVTWDSHVHEEVPVKGESYIFFLKTGSQEGIDPFTVLKLLPATDDNIAKVKALIAAAPASK